MIQGFIFPFNEVEKGSKIILYGGGIVGRQFLSQIKALNYCFVLFIVDRNWKEIKEIDGVIVCAPEEIRNCDYDKIAIASKDYIEEIKENLLNFNVAEEKLVSGVSIINYDYKDEHKEQLIINYENKIKNIYSQMEELYLMMEPLIEIKEYYSCNSLENCELIFSGNIISENNLKFCCGNHIDRIPFIECQESKELTMKKFMKRRKAMIIENRIFSIMGNNEAESRFFTRECMRCYKYKLKDWGKSDDLIHKIIIGKTPSPCQLKCIYCEHHKNKISQNYKKQIHIKYLKEIINMIEWVQNNGMLANDIRYSLSGGEITIHPDKKMIYNIVNNKICSFISNCLIYDEYIVANLAANPESRINFSIDSGTPETWYKVKGINNFEKVLENFAKYAKSRRKPEQIYLKYIILPGINDNLKDYYGVLEIIKKNEIKQLHISRDFKNVFHNIFGTDSDKNLTEAAGYLVALLIKNKINYILAEDAYSQHEHEQIILFANEVLESNKI